MMRQIIFFKIFIILGFVPIVESNTSLCSNPLLTDVLNAPPYWSVLFDKQNSLKFNLDILTKHPEYGLEVEFMPTYLAEHGLVYYYAVYKIPDKTGTSDPIYIEVDDTSLTIWYCRDTDMSEYLSTQRPKSILQTIFLFSQRDLQWWKCKKGFNKTFNASILENGYFELSDQRLIFEEINRRQPYNPNDHGHKATAVE